MPTVQLKLEEAKLKATIKGLKKMGDGAVQAAKDELGRTAINMLGVATENLNKNGSKATGGLINSGKVKERKNGWDVGFYTSYAYFVEFGRRAGSKRPPLNAILKWVHKKRLAYYKVEITRGKNKGKMREEKGAGYWKAAMMFAILIANSIGKKGIPAKPFFYPAYERVIKGLSQRLITAVNNAMK